MARRATTATLPSADFAAAIAERAYFKAEQRGFVPGHELEDWLAAEREIFALGAPAPAATKKPVVRRKSSATSKPKSGSAAKTKKK